MKMKHLKKFEEIYLSKFTNEHQELLWLQEQCRLLWEFVDKENLSEEAEKFINDEGGTMENFV